MVVFRGLGVRIDERGAIFSCQAFEQDSPGNAVGNEVMRNDAQPVGRPGISAKHMAADQPPSARVEGTVEVCTHRLDLMRGLRFRGKP